MSLYLCIIGSSNLDHVVNVADFPKPGQTITAENYQLVYGGKGANQAVAAVKSGGNVHFVSRLGNDAEGQKMCTHFAELGMNVDAVKSTSEQPTGQAIIQVNQNGENAIAVVAGANQCLDEQAIGVEAEHIQQADLVLIQLETDFSGIKKAIDIAAQADKKIILNPAPAQILSDDILAKLWLITPNETETEQLTGIAVTDSQSAKIAAQALIDKGVQQVIITMGKNGVYYHSEVTSELHQGFSVKATDTTAAGDTFNGALATALLNNKEMPEAIRFAQAAAALSVQKSGAQPSIPSYDEIVSFLKS
ncbi:MAG: ribokinase [Gammaproteobacteria bacterium]|nr:ribokinase [Gammaproteobacteria bacterium]